MAYSTSSPPALISEQIGGGFGLWIYRNTDAVTVVRANNYISNARALGIKKGDLIMYVKTDASPITLQLMIVSAINADGSADLSDGTAVTGTNTD